MIDPARAILAENITTVGIDEKIELARWSSGNALLVGGLLAIAALYAVGWMYRREGRGTVSRRLRWTLVACRVMVLVLLGVIGLEPVLVKYVHRRLGAHTLVLVDDSASMALADQYRRTEDRSRVEAVVAGVPTEGLVREAICLTIVERDNRRWLDALAEKNEVRVFSFGDRLVARASIPRDRNGKAGLPAPVTPHPNGAATDLGLAVRGALDSVAGAPVAGIILLTDGRFNRGESPGVIARFLKQAGVDLFVIGVGDPAEPVNVRVVRLETPRSVFKNDPFSVTVRIEAEGVGEDAIKVELFERRGEGDDTREALVAGRTVRPDADGHVAPVVFECKISKPGAVGYVARVSPRPYEVVTSDNRRESRPAVRILDDKMKVLLVAGAPSYDYRFLARMLERDATVDLSTWLQSADAGAVRDGNTIITELPTTPAEINRYDALILMDCDPGEFDPTWGSILASYVSDHGGGLLYQAGRKYTGRFFRSAKMQSLTEVLPVVPDPEAEIVINELGHYQFRPWPIGVPKEAASDPILRQSDDPSESRVIWAALGGVYWHYPVRREKPVARVLMRHTNPRMANEFGEHVLFATQLVGTGRTAYLAIDSTWRWRRSDERYFNRFWIQTLRYLVEGKLLGGRARGWILTPKDEYEVGETIVAMVRALDERFEPLLMPQLEMVLSSANGGDTTPSRTVTLTPIPGRAGYYEGRFTPARVGTLRLRLSLPGAPARDDADRSKEVTKEIVVSQPDLELRSISMDRAGLRALAEAAGGNSRYLDIDQADRLPTLIEDQSRTFTVRGRPRPLWNHPSVFIVLISLLTIEWILRNKARLL
ncbi:MAG: hypothetical protein ACE5E1_10790 [Phycisphaerae bacterium]